MSPLVAATVPFLMFFLLIGWLWRNQRRSKAARKAAGRSVPLYPLYPVQFEAAPDLPVPFGYKTQWLAVRTTDTEAVAKCLRLERPQPANWKTGMNGAAAGYYFVTPPVHGWTLVVNPYMPDLSGKEEPGPLQLLERLSAAFGEAGYFASHRVVGYHAWVRARKGEIVRGYAYVGEQGETILDHGGLSSAEREANLTFTGLEAEEPVLPDEDDVLLMAKLWSVDPAMAQGGYEAGTGLAGVLESAPEE